MLIKLVANSMVGRGCVYAVGELWLVRMVSSHCYVW
jgi:hypothetical protein